MMAKKISKKAFQAQYEKYKMLELKASLSAQRYIMIRGNLAKLP